ncbi:MAG: NAD-dependent succinate-semialdehyde dehydrogenase [Trueperaceae bacterium]
MTTTSFIASLEGKFFTGEWRKAKKTYTVKNPAMGKVLAKVAECTSTDAAQAAATSMEAFQLWKKKTAFERADILMRWFDLMMKHQEDLAHLMTQEMGKPIKESRGEVAYAAGFIKWYAEEAKRVGGETFPATAGHKRLLAIKQPVGPVFAITPWNFPYAMVTRKAAPALAAGCTMILKPAEQTPLSALMLAKLWAEAGGPEGTFQVLTASNPVPVSDTLIGDPRIRKITFTGSTEVGKLLYKKSADTVKKISLELGGHAPFLVFEDADLDQAVKEAIACKFRNTGQTCVCTNRIYVHNNIVDEFAKRYAKVTATLKVGDPLDSSTDIGPLVSKEGLQKVKFHVQDAVSKGAIILTGGKSIKGLFFEPTVLVNVDDDMQMMYEETFGPVAPIATFNTDDEAIQMANDTPYGLASYIYTNDLSRAFKVVEALEYGIVGVNDGVPSVPHAPFGGVKESGLGREGGHWGLEEYLEVKYISMALHH